MSPDDRRHGTHRGYVVGCRKECCRRAQMVYMKRYRMGQVQHMVDPTGTVRRLQALAALGYSGKQISLACGYTAEWSRHVMGSRLVTETTAATVDALFERWSMALADHQYADRVRRQAAAKGWAVPLAWDDIDDPAEQPKGVRSATPFDDDRLDRILELDEMHTGIDEVCAALGIGRDALWKWCDKQGRRDLYARISGRTRTMPNQWTGVA